MDSFIDISLQLSRSLIFVQKTLDHLFVSIVVRHASHQKQQTLRFWRRKSLGHSHCQELRERTNVQLLSCSGPRTLRWKFGGAEKHLLLELVWPFIRIKEQSHICIPNKPNGNKNEENIITKSFRRKITFYMKHQLRSCLRKLNQSATSKSNFWSSKTLMDRWWLGAEMFPLNEKWKTYWFWNPNGIN